MTFFCTRTFGDIFSSKKATIRLQPEYTVGIIKRKDISTWHSSVTSTSFEQVPAEFAQSNCANVRLRVTINREVDSLENRVEWTLFDFFAGVVCCYVFCCCFLIIM